MTVNERLVTLGLMDSFDASIKNGDKQTSIEILLSAKFEKEQATETVLAILQNPKKYGY